MVYVWLYDCYENIKMNHDTVEIFYYKKKLLFKKFNYVL